MPRLSTKPAPADWPVLGPLKSRNVVVAGHRTTMRLEPALWDALDAIGRREGLTLHQLCTRVKERLGDQEGIRARLDPNRAPSEGGRARERSSFTAAVRVFVAAYYRHAAEHSADAPSRAKGDLFTGTPFELTGHDRVVAEPEARV